VNFAALSKSKTRCSSFCSCSVLASVTSNVEFNEQFYSVMHPSCVIAFCSLTVKLSLKVSLEISGQSPPSELCVCNLVSVVFLCNLGAYQKALLKRYAKQLEADSMFHKAANIYLSIHHVYDAINMLADNSLFK